MIASLFLAVLPLIAAAPSPWAQPADAPVYDLFKRQAATYPPALRVPDIANIPKEWLDKLKLVEKDIAKSPVATPVNSTDANAVTYPTGSNLQANGNICAYSTGCTRPDDIRDGPAGSFMITFDDGPGDGTQMLSDFLDQRNMSTHATHFMIGASIIAEPALFKTVFDRGGHIASHTWSHGRMTTLTNEQIVGELGWTMKAIADNTGGRLPLYWRPPYGDLDDRVRDVASKVFGLKCVLWNADSSDWQIATKGKGPTEAEFDRWVNLPKTGPGVNALMHEINPRTVEIFMDKFQSFVNSGWRVESVAEAQKTGMYFNAADNKSPVTQMTINDLGAKPPAQPNATVSGGAAGTSGGAADRAASPAPSTGAARALFAPVASVLLAAVAAALF